jgi:hypothetical protein
MTASGQTGIWVRKLQRFVQPPSARAEAEYCELCASPIPPRHPHLVQPAKHRLICACRGCALLLGNRDDASYRLVPELARELADFHLSDPEWDALGIPIGLAFFCQSSVEERVVAFYPGPAGPTESLLDLDAWSAIVANNPALSEIEPDTEALLANRMNGARRYYRAPIDRCYELVGLMRMHWRGVSGGDEAWRAIDGFFGELAERHGRGV